MVNVGKCVPVPWMRHGIGKLCVVSMAVGLIQLAVGFDLCPNLWNDLYVESPYQKNTNFQPNHFTATKSSPEKPRDYHAKGSVGCWFQPWFQLLKRDDQKLSEILE